MSCVRARADEKGSTRYSGCYRDPDGRERYAGTHSRPVGRGRINILDTDHMRRAGGLYLRPMLRVPRRR